MTRRRLLVFGLLAGLLALGVGGWLLWPRTAITRENDARILEGMTLAEVEAILCGPARDERTGPVDRESDALTAHFLGPPSVPNSSLCEWHSDHVYIQVIFDANGRVTNASSCPLHRVQESPLAVLRRWLRL